MPYITETQRKDLNELLDKLWEAIVVIDDLPKTPATAIANSHAQTALLWLEDYRRKLES